MADGFVQRAKSKERKLVRHWHRISRGSLLIYGSGTHGRDGLRCKLEATVERLPSRTSSAMANLALSFALSDLVPGGRCAEVEPLTRRSRKVSAGSALRSRHRNCNQRAEQHYRCSVTELLNKVYPDAGK